MSTYYNLKCETCGDESPGYSYDADALAEAIDLWPHIKAIEQRGWEVRNCMIYHEEPPLFDFLRQHEGHDLGVYGYGEKQHLR